MGIFGCAETEAMRILVRVIRDIRETHTDIRFHITSGHEEVISERLERGLVDFGVFMEPANLLFNASLMVEEGLGYAICLDGIIPTVAELPLCFRPLEPRMEAGVSVAWKKHQILSKACQLFLDRLQHDIAGNDEQ